MRSSLAILGLLVLQASPLSAAASLRFFGNGTGDIDRVKIRIDGPARPVDVAGDLTLEFWLKATLAENDAPACTPGPIGLDGWITGNIVFDRDVFGDGDFGDYGVSLRGGRVAFGVSVGAAGETLCGARNVADGSWHHVAVTRRASDGQLRLFVDGQADGSTTAPTGNLSYRDGRTTAFPNSDPFLVIGAEKHDAGPGFPSFSGWIDEVRLSNVVRYPAAFSRPPFAFETDAATVGLYHLDEGSGDVVFDTSGAAGGPSNGQRRFGGSPSAGPAWSVDAAPLGQRTRLELTPVVAGLESPVLVTHAGDGTGRLFLVEQTGRIRLLDASGLRPTPFLDLTDRVLSGGERGLLSLAFHPSYETNGFFYVLYTRREDPGTPETEAGDVVLARFSRSPSDPNQGDPGSELRLKLAEHSSFSNHNGGHLAFGPDGYLYATIGDGGSGGDPDENGQSLGTLLGKLQRLDVNAPAPYIPPTNPFVGVGGARGEIWAYGLRNTWRFAFDRLTGDLFLGDVGQGQWEEIDFQPAASVGGQNYGWDVLEGAHCFEDVPSGSCAAFLNGGSTLPIFEYQHTSGNNSVTGGHVLRRRHATLSDSYLYADFVSGRLWSLARNAQGGWTNSQLFDTAFNISSLGEDESGNLYLLDYGGGVLYRVNPYTFADVPPTAFGWPYTDALYTAGVTAGCTGGNYCPSTSVTRAQMSVFLLRGRYDATFLPPPATGTVFADVGAGDFAAAWIERLAAEGITGGCNVNPPLFCPSSAVNRRQMAVFLLRALEGPGYTPPPASGVFDDVPASDPFAPWVEELAARGITTGCSVSPPLYCPLDPVTRAQMAVFMTRNFALPIP